MTGLDDDYDSPKRGKAASEADTMSSRDGSVVCFVAGTKVLSASGQLVNIEDICVGDHVLSRNLDTGENEDSTVVQTMPHDVNEDIYALEMDGDVVCVTGHHKFMTLADGKWTWKEACELKTGDSLMNSYGNHVILRSTSHSP